MAGCTRVVTYSKKTLFYKAVVYLNILKKQQHNFDHTVAFYYFKNANES